MAMFTTEQGALKKMIGTLDDHNQVQYQLPIGEQRVALNALIGQSLTLEFHGEINCLHCQRKTKKSYSQGYCFPCMQKLAQCDMCIMKPETCHYTKGTCREPEWGVANCMIPHYVYLSNTSGIKVGITRHSQIPTRWIDQGATQALPIFKVNTRLQSGLIEVALAKHIADKTNWRAMLKGNALDVDLKAYAEQLIPQIRGALDNIIADQPEGDIEQLISEVVSIRYPVLKFPEKVSSFNFDKTAQISGNLVGIKGQYLIFDTGVINIRKFTSYRVSATFEQ